MPMIHRCGRWQMMCGRADMQLSATLVALAGGGGAADGTAASSGHFRRTAADVAPGQGAELRHRPGTQGGARAGESVARGDR